MPPASRKPVGFAVKKIPSPWWWSKTWCIGQGIGRALTYALSKSFIGNGISRRCIGCIGRHRFSSVDYMNFCKCAVWGIPCIF